GLRPRPTHVYGAYGDIRHFIPCILASGEHAEFSRQAILRKRAQKADLDEITLGGLSPQGVEQHGNTSRYRRHHYRAANACRARLLQEVAPAFVWRQFLHLNCPYRGLMYDAAQAQVVPAPKK